MSACSWISAANNCGIVGSAGALCGNPSAYINPKKKGYSSLALQVGDIVEGKVTGLKPFGAFVSLPEGKTGLVHISEVSYEFVQDISAVLEDGQAVTVKVLSIAPDGKIALSIKRTQPAPERGARPQGGSPRPAARRPKREEKPRVWQPKPAAPQGEMSFEDMMARYKSRSEEKIADLKRVTENHRGGYSRRRG
ncbi:S1 RNA-binding domain-containing protein [uncultured Subdoligranulum sp.]